jgi:hypothetical protein
MYYWIYSIAADESGNLNHNHIEAVSIYFSHKAKESGNIRVI